MKKKCSNDLYHSDKDLEDLLNEIEDKVKEYDDKRQELYWKIQREKETNPSEELIKIEDKYDEGVFPEVKLDMSEQKPQQKVCRYNSHGSCKRGDACNFFHSIVDCKQHITQGYCSQRTCTDRHRYTCRFYNSTNGCKKEACAYLHKVYNKDSEEINNVKELEAKITQFKLDVKDKDKEIMAAAKVIHRLQKDLESKEREIKEKDTIINIMKYNYEESDEENENPEDLKETSTYNADVNDSSFDFTQLELDLPDVQEVRDKHTDASETDLKCKKCDYKCKRENTLKKHINTKHS